jgi:hypothetical protein
MTELAYVTKPLKGSRIDELRRSFIYADVVPERVADGERHQVRGEGCATRDAGGEETRRELASRLLLVTRVARSASLTPLC